MLSSSIPPNTLKVHHESFPAIKSCHLEALPNQQAPRKSILIHIPLSEKKVLGVLGYIKATALEGSQYELNILNDFFFVVHELKPPSGIAENKQLQDMLRIHNVHH